MASLEEIRNERIKKLELLKEKGINPYPITTNRDFTVEKALADFTKLSKRKNPLSVAGRVMALRGQGALVFGDIDDGTGRIQVLFKKDELGEEKIKLLTDTADIGDFISCKGGLFTTKRKEKTLLVKDWSMLSKSLRPLPDKFHGLQDVEERFRRRYLDTLSSPEVKERFILRSKFVSELRKELDGQDFMEVETPILQPLAGGANAEPFTTHHNALDIDLNLRIAPELYLKELLIGGFPKVYEIGRLFRNEGIDVTHNPEFTTMELYENFASAGDHMELLEKLLKKMVKNTTGKTSITYNGEKIDFGKKYNRVSLYNLLKQYALIPDPENATDEELVLKAKQFGGEVHKGEPRYKILDTIYKRACRPKLIQPTFIVDYPVEFSPLAKRQEGSDTLIDRYQLVAGGLELVNAFSELNDPLDQRERFMHQEKNKEKGDKEAQPKDEEFIEAIEYGLPPSAGLGLSIDRMVMLLTDAHNIREVIFFPTLRPRE